MKKVSITRIVLSSIISLFFILAAYSKFSQIPVEMSMLKSLHLEMYHNALGIIDLIIAASLWSRHTRRIGVLVGTAYLGGAIASELSLGATGLTPGILIIFLWIIHKIDLRKDCSCGVCDSCVIKTVPQH